MSPISILNFVVKEKPIPLKASKERKREAIGDAVMFAVGLLFTVWMLYNSFF